MLKSDVPPLTIRQLWVSQTASELDTPKQNANEKPWLERPKIAQTLTELKIGQDCLAPAQATWSEPAMATKKMKKLKR